MATYETRFVTYMDILGFRDLVGKLNPKKVGQLRDTLRTTALQSEDVTGKEVPSTSSYFFKMFSDSMTMSILANRVKPLRFLSHVAKFQASLASKGMFLRGSIVLGDQFEDEGISFGPALICAVDLEGDVAIWPRVVVHPDIVRMCCDDGASWPLAQAGDGQVGVLLRKDSDGIAYLNYIRIFHDSLDSIFAGRFLANHRNQILRKVRVASKKIGILAKYYWLATYHNSEMAELNRRDCLIDMRLAFPDL